MTGHGLSVDATIRRGGFSLTVAFEVPPGQVLQLPYRLLGRPGRVLHHDVPVLHGVHGQPGRQRLPVDSGRRGEREVRT